MPEMGHFLFVRVKFIHNEEMKKVSKKFQIIFILFLLN